MGHTIWILGTLVVGMVAFAWASWPAPRVAEAAVPEASAEQGFTLAHWPLEGAAAHGREVYERNCIGCHGEEGRGDGEVAHMLDPLPRNLQEGFFKFRSTPGGELPVEEDLMHVVTCGLPGSAMRGFPLLPERDRRAVVAYVLSLAEFGLVEPVIDEMLAEGRSLEEVMEEDFEDVLAEEREYAWEEAWPVPVPPRPELGPDAVERGRELFAAQCAACHGETGRGDGPSSYHLRDWKDAPIRPRDLTTGVFRAGSRPEDLWLRLRTGLNGTPMPASYSPDDDLWDLVAYIASLERAGAPDPHPTSCAAREGVR